MWKKLSIAGYVRPFYIKEFSNTKTCDVIIRYYPEDNRTFNLCDIDVNSDGYLLPYRAAEFSKLDIDLKVGESMSAVSNMVKHTKNTSEWDEDNGSYTITGTSTVVTKENVESILNPNAELGSDIEWSSSDPSVVTVDSNGNIEAVKKGQAKIIAKVKGTDVKSCFTVNSRLIGDNGEEIDEENGGFITIDGKRYYLYKGEKIINEWNIIDGDWYYFTEDGSVATGLREIDGEVFYFDNEGKQMIGLQNINGNSYYFYDDGIMATGWKEIDGETYYYTEDGQLYSGWNEVDGKLYYFNSKGYITKNKTMIKKENGKIIRYILGPDGVAVKQ